MKTALKIFAVVGVSLFSSATWADAPLKVNFADADVIGKFGCKAKYPGSFRQGVLNKCFTCPTGLKRNLPIPIGTGRECKRKSYKKPVKFLHLSKPKGVLRPCPGDPKFNPIAKICYICPKGSKLNPGKKRCEQKVPATYSRAKFQGERGCPKGSFRNGVGKTCLKCPSGYVRAKLWKKVKDDKAENACMRMEMAKLQPPKWLKIDPEKIAEARAFIEKNAKLIGALGSAATRLSEARAKGVKVRNYDDPTLIAELNALEDPNLRRRPIRGCEDRTFLPRSIVPKAASFGFVVDGSVSIPFPGLHMLALGGNVTSERIIDFNAQGFSNEGRALAFSATAGKGGDAADGTAGVQVTGYFLAGPTQPSHMLVVEGGKMGGKVGGFKKGMDISFAFAVVKATSGPKEGKNICPMLIGVTVGVNSGLDLGGEADLGYVYSHYMGN
ncbi:MAG: hypothetical protein AAF557_00815 [Pseudomonadota bacterium]